MPKLQRLSFQPDQFQDGRVSLSSDQHRYLTKVLRLKARDRFIAMDGLGHWWMAELNLNGMSATLLEPIQVNHELPIEITLVAAPPKGKGFEEVIHGATELGVRHIYPLMSERTQLCPSDKKLNRWQRIAVEAAEQSLRQFVPTINSPISVDQLFQKLQPDSETLIFFCSTQPHRIHLAQALKPLSSGQHAILLTGPEGGWSPQEEQAFLDRKWMGVSLGQRVLRAVTAPICALSLMASHCEMQALE